MWATQKYKEDLTLQLAEPSFGVVNLGIIKVGFTVAWGEMHEAYRKVRKKRPQNETKHLKWTNDRLCIDYNFRTKKKKE
jgi:hypothetical protein